MAKFKITNHMLAPDHPVYSATVTSDDMAFTRIVSRLAGAGLSTEATAKAMALGRELQDMEVGKERRFTKKDHYDLTIARLED